MHEAIRPARTGRFLGVLLATVLLVDSRSARAAVNRWTSGGPWSGNVTAIAADPSNPQTVYAAAQYDGIFRSRDGGVSWQPINNGLLDFWITGLAIDPSTPTTLYASSSGFFVYKTSDAGDHWVSLYVNDPTSSYGEASAIAVDPLAPSTVYAATLAGVWKTTDGGCSWAPSNTGLPTTQIGAVAIMVDPADDRIVIVSTFLNGLYRSVDAGASWSHVESFVTSGEHANALAADPVNAGVFYAATSYFIDPTAESGGSLYKSVDGGSSWTPIGTLPNEPFRSVVVDLFSPAIYLGSEVGSVRRSLDGSTWAVVNEGLPAQAAGDLALGPQPNLLWVAAGGAAVFKTTDAGATWADANAGIEGLFGPHLLVHPSDDSTIWCSNGWGDGAGIFRSADAGQTWVRSATGLGPQAVVALAATPGPPVTLFAGLDFRGGIYRSTDLGENWSPAGALPGDTTPEVSDLVVPPTMPTRVYAAAGQLFLSDDGGDTWTPASSDSHNLFFIWADSGVAGRLLGFVDGLLQVSTDSGATWTPSDEGIDMSPVIAIGQDPSNGDHLLAGIQNDPSNPTAPIYTSSDRGATWTPSDDGIPQTNSIVSVAFDAATPSTVYATAYGPEARAIYRSLDGGDTWQPFDRGLPRQFLDFSQVATSSDGSRLHLAGAGGVFEMQKSPTPPPSVSLVHPTSGSASGGTLVVVSGTGLGSTSSLLFANTPAGAFKVVDDGHVAAITPAGAPGSVSATVSTSEPQDDTLERAFVYDFADLPPSSPFHDSVVALTLRAVTGGCGAGNFCPNASLNRGQAAVQIEKALHGADGSLPPPFASPDLSMADVEVCSGFAPYVYQFLVVDQVTAGCGFPNYCPLNPVTRAQMMVFLLRGEHGSAYLPPPATGTVFADVPADAFAADYIEAAAQEGLTAGCGGGNFCPNSPVTRGQAAALILKTFPTAP
ncbi:MAG TPA: S-layer homology domain-containing protein [Thermoanaerobaculia bacterium]|nr:S-layer homology domain-containing protein [Thermoanaerobaculia bacterium]